MKSNVFLFVLFSTIPGLLARGSGAPPEACNDLMPRHSGVNSQPSNIGYFILSEAVGGYTPGREYLVELRGESETFKGFFIQARTEINQDSQSSIVGVWTPLNTSTARIARCNGVDGDAVTHSSNAVKKSQFFMWRAPNNDVGRIHFVYSIARTFSTIYVRLNATEERPSSAIGPPSRPPVDAVFPNSYSQPEGCDRDMCVFYVEWRNNGQFLDFRMEGDSIGWIALGVSSVDTPLNRVGRAFSDILMCQANMMTDDVFVKDLFLAANGSIVPMFDSSVNGTEYASGRIADDRIFCNFSRVGFVLLNQEDQDVAFNDDNFLFFLSGDNTGTVDDIPRDFNESALNVTFSTQINLERPLLSAVQFFGSFDSLNGRGSFPSDDCDPDDCDFYFRWGINPNNPAYLTFYINADIGRGWAAIGVSPDRRMGGDEIDDVFGCITRRTGEGDDVVVAAIDTHNIQGGDRQNVGDGGTDGIRLHNGSVIDARITCLFSRLIPVINGSEASDLNLNNSYYIIIGIGNYPGPIESPRTNFPQHERTPLVSTSRVNLVTETSVDFDYSKIILIKLHGVFMLLAWPFAAYIGKFTAAHMKPALPNGGWFQMHRIFMVAALFFTCVGFMLIFVAFRNAPTQGLITLGDLNKTGTAHFVFGIMLTLLVIGNPIFAIFRCKPDSKNRWIFNIIHGLVVGILGKILSSININIGLNLFAEKYASHEEQAVSAFGAILAFIILYSLTDIAMTIYDKVTEKFKREWVVPDEQKDNEKKKPAKDYLFRWVVWTIVLVLSIVFNILAIGLVSSA